MSKDILDLDFFNSLSKSNKAIITMSLMGFKIDNEGNFNHWRNSSVRIMKDKDYYSYAYRLPRKVFGNKTVYVDLHRYQAFKKYGMDLFNKEIEVRHLNGNSLDNSWQNIAIGTPSQNAYDKPKEVRDRVSKIGSKVAAKKKREENKQKWKKVYKDREDGLTYDELKFKYNLSKSTLSYHLGEGKKKVKKEYVDIINN